MSYFAEWYACRKTRKDHIDINVINIWDKGVMSNITYYIMHLGCIGFLGYCKYMLKTNHNLVYVPVLHANTSSLESHFSLMRWHHADTPAKYETTFNIADNEKSMKIMERNPMYLPNKENYKAHTCITGEKSKVRIQKVLKHEKVKDYDIFVSTFYLDEGRQNFGYIGDMCLDVKNSCMYGYCKSHLLKNTRFREYCVAAMNTTHEAFFIYFLELYNDSEIHMFNTICQKVMTHLCLCLDVAIGFDK